MKSNLEHPVSCVPTSLPSGQNHTWGAIRRLALIVLFAIPLAGSAQSDNFDAYSSSGQLSAAGWIHSALDPSLVTTTFPRTESGKGLRIQANPVPGQAPAV